MKGMYRISQFLRRRFLYKPRDAHVGTVCGGSFLLIPGELVLILGYSIEDSKDMISYEKRVILQEIVKRVSQKSKKT